MTQYFRRICSSSKNLCIDNLILHSAVASAFCLKIIDADLAMDIPLSIKSEKHLFD
jgi:uncharacterized ferredoxin-like protein